MALNVTTAVIGSGCNTATATPSLAQWDQGQVLKIEGVDLPAAYQVEFSTEYTRNAIPRIGNADGVSIPNELLQRSAPITAYIVLHEGESDRETEYWITIHITPRTPPETVTPDPEQMDVIDETIAALQAGVAAAEAAAESVQNMGVEAETLAPGSPLTVTKEVDPETGAVTLIFGLTQGPKGDNGYSPTITITEISGGHRFTVTDAIHPNGQSFDVLDGAKGDQGDDGYSPVVTITTITGGHRFTVTDKAHPNGQSFDVLDGAKGDQGDDGYSPVVTITTITGGHRVTITDKTHQSGQSFDVMDGVVQSVNGKSAAAITLDSGDIGFDDSETYAAGSIGAEVSNQKNALSAIDTIIGEDNTESGSSVTVEADAEGLPPKQITAEVWFTQSGNGDPSPSNVRPITGYKECTITIEGEDSQEKSVTVNFERFYAEVYGGRVVFNQDGTVDLIRTYHVASPTWTWTKVSNNNYRNFYVAPITYPPKYDADKPTVFSSHYKSVCANNGTTTSGDNYIWMWYNNGTPAIAIKDTSKSGMTAAQFKTAMADVKIIYELNTPLTVRFPNVEQLRLFLGENSISANTGDVSVTMTTLDKSMMLYADYESNRAKAMEEIVRLGLHTIPVNRGQLNVVKRVRQLTDVKWTPAVDLARHMKIGEERWNTLFKAGVEYTGIPYGESDDDIESRYGYPRMSVGLETSVETFVTSVSCKDSIICKEDVGSVEKHISTVYSCACDGLVCYALNVEYKYAPSIPTISGMTAVGRINDNGTLISPAVFGLGDVLQISSHVGIITDIIPDENGEAAFIEVSEETSTGEDIIDTEGGQVGGLARRKAYELTSFYDVWGAYTLYRYSNIGSVPYTPSRYVNVGDELDMLRYERFACMPYEGNGFRFKTGYIPDNAVKILIEASGYDNLRVFKDGEEISTSPIAISDGDEYASVTETSAGSYEAYLCRMSGGSETTKTHNCSWTIIS